MRGGGASTGGANADGTSADGVSGDRASTDKASGALRGQMERGSARIYLGFDANEYPGDAAWSELRRTFVFCGYWLNAPPGTTTNSWAGKRGLLLQSGFGFLVLFDGRLARELGPPVNPADFGAADAEAAAEAAQREGFPTGTVIYLDIEEGGRMLPQQAEYIATWSRGVEARGFAAGVYCSAMKVKDGRGKTITSADDIQERMPVRAYFVYNDECPPAPGCAYLKNPPAPAESGFSAARVWQFAQSPRRRNYTRRCRATYNADGNCYAPGVAGVSLDLDSSVMEDPSAAGR
ncbi:MAG: glycoside hydrolase domain-containing protein [Candidatus Acidiferrales bacterium]